MEKNLLLIGRLAGIVGTLACVLAIVLRLLGTYGIGSLSMSALMQGGIALVVIGCFGLLLGRPPR